jgi:hypothetical protein
VSFGKSRTNQSDPVAGLGEQQRRRRGKIEFNEILFSDLKMKGGFNGVHED